MRVAVIGAGGWGTALSVVAARAGCEVRLWARNAAVVEEINISRVNGAYLEGQKVPEGVRATTGAGAALKGAELVVLAAPSHATRAVLESMRGLFEPDAVFVSATKGVEVETGEGFPRSSGKSWAKARPRASRVFRGLRSRRRSRQASRRRSWPLRVTRRSRDSCSGR